MIRYLLYLSLARLAALRLRYWTTVCSGQRRQWGAAHPVDSKRLVNALLARSHWRQRAESVLR